MSKPEFYYWSEEMKRTLEDLLHLCMKKKDKFGCINPPLLNIKLDNVRVDELHLLLRITGGFWVLSILNNLGHVNLSVYVFSKLAFVIYNCMYFSTFMEGSRSLMPATYMK